ncbi:MAG: hypothetical protein JSU94_15640 [Phycisphaerales bacterium]|nr:MAG: hypothetical protein JSU94_15640 [Phycisphaerales bacterium]
MNAGRIRGNVTVLVVTLATLIHGGNILGSTKTYEFVADQSTLIWYLGYTGWSIPHSIEGTFRLTVDFDAGLASFDQVNSFLTDARPPLHYPDLNLNGYSLDELFHMSELAGTVLSSSTARFTGQFDIEGTQVNIVIDISIVEDSVHLLGTCQCAEAGYDFDSFSLDAVALRCKDAYHVDKNGDDNNDGLSRETAFATIQKGIDTADAGDTVLIWPGLYNESINFKGRAITLKSAADAAIIEAPGADAVTFHAGEGPASVLKNFVIRNSGLAISLNYGSSPTISNLTIVDNDFGIAAYENSNPDISNCIFADNRDGNLFGCTARYSCGAGQPADEPIEGLVSHWKFDEGTGTTAYDSAGDNHGTIHGAQWTAGRFNNALDFDGNDGVDVEGSSGAASTLNIHDSDLTVSAWVKTRGTGGTIVARAKPLYITYRLFVDTDKAGINTYRQGSGHWVLSAEEALSANTWYHLVGVFDRTRDIGQVYINGIKEAEGPMTLDPVSNDATTKIGCLLLGQAESAFDGVIDEVMIFNRALSEQQIQQLYSDDQSEPVSHWKFDEGVGSIAYDSAGDNHGTIYGAQWTAGMAGGALDFDGFGDYVRVSDPTSLDLDTRYTVSAWIKTDTISAKNAIIVAYRDRVTPSVLFQLDRYGADMRFVVVDEAANTLVALYPGALLANSWYHVAGVRDGDSLKVFVNGVKGPTVYKAFGQIIPSLVTIGAIDCCARGVHAYFQGSIDEVVVFDGALSDQHIQQLYQGGSGGPGPGLDPLFADPNGGDYHLKSERGRYWPEHDIWVLDKVTSPCIDAGDPADDYSAEPAPNGSRINAGAYGGTASASRSEWTSSVDINGDGVVDVRDISIIADNWLRGAGPTPPPDDNVPPTPNPMTWASPPSALSATTISMTATTAADESGIQYYFECISGGGHNSDWRDEPTYTDSGLDPNTEYCYRVKARDKSASRNETGWSVTAWATTTAADQLVIDDFEDYNNHTPDRIFQWWLDGFGFGAPPPSPPPYYPGNGSGSIIGYPNPPFAEQMIVHAGSQSMPFCYNNNRVGMLKYSETNRTLTDPRNWTLAGAKTLSIWYRGYPASTGGYFYDPPTHAYTVGGAGTDIWDVPGRDGEFHDEFHFVYRTFTGAGAIQARVDSIQNTNDWAKAGLMIRDKLDADSVYSMVTLTPTQGLLWQYRMEAGGPGAMTQVGGITAPQWIRISRDVSGTVMAEYSDDGSTWTTIGTPLNIPMNTPMYIGLAVTSHSPAVTCQAVFSNVSFPNTTPGPTWASQDIGIQSNDPEKMYVAIANSNRTTAVVTNPDTAAAQAKSWTEWRIPLIQFSSQGVNLTDVNEVSLGFGTRGNATTPGGSGLVFFDDICLDRN